MDEEEFPPLVYTSVEAHGDGWRVAIQHPSYNGGSPIYITGYSSEAGANAGARWWDERLVNTPPDELHCMTGVIYERTA